MDAYETRRERVLHVIAEAGYASVEELSHQLAVSAMTVRRDLQRLEDEGLARRTHGGVTLGTRQNEPRFGERATASLTQKRAIGRAASEFVSDGQTIILDAGTTTLEIARQLCSRRGITIITNSVRVVDLSAGWPELAVICTGGRLKHQELALVGPAAEQTLLERHADIAFCSAAGFSIEHGATDYEDAEVAVKRQMIKAAARRYLVADSTKAGTVTPMVIAPMATFDGLISDDALSDETANRLRAMGLDVVVAPSIAELLDGTKEPVGDHRSSTIGGAAPR